jgi:hypothetical protein
MFEQTYDDQIPLENEINQLRGSLNQWDYFLNYRKIPGDPAQKNPIFGLIMSGL